jgi:acyl dehydratase
MTRYMSDLAVGQSFRSPARRITEESIFAFAREFDPQPFHLDHAAAQASLFKGLSASGWHTAAFCFRLVVDTDIGFVDGIIGTGIDELRWLAPVRPGDELTVTTTVAAIEVSPKNPDRGFVHCKHVATNQAGAAVYSFKSRMLTRNAGANGRRA